MADIKTPLSRLQAVNLQTSNQEPAGQVSDVNDLTKLSPNDPPRTLFRPGMISFDPRAAMLTPARLREAFILNEILQPPASVRRPHGRA